MGKGDHDGSPASWEVASGEGLALILDWPHISAHQSANILE
jgi:hypothetical protein